MTSLAQEAAEKICQLFQDCSSSLQLEVCVYRALIYLCCCPFEKISLLFLSATLSVALIVLENIQHFVLDCFLAVSFLNNCFYKQIIDSIIGF